MNVLQRSVVASKGGTHARNVHVYIVPVRITFRTPSTRCSHRPHISAVPWGPPPRARVLGIQIWSLTDGGKTVELQRATQPRIWKEQIQVRRRWTGRLLPLCFPRRLQPCPPLHHFRSRLKDHCAKTNRAGGREDRSKRFRPQKDGRGQTDGCTDGRTCVTGGRSAERTDSRRSRTVGRTCVCGGRTDAMTHERLEGWIEDGPTDGRADVRGAGARTVSRADVRG